MTLRSTLASAALATLGIATVSATGAERPPKLGELHYEKESGSLGQATGLQVWGNRIDGVTFRVRREGKVAKAGGVEDESIRGANRFDPHPWVPDPKDGRRAVLNAIKDSIAATGAATVKLTAKNDAGTTKEKGRIVFSECHMDPPIYPFTCIVEL